MTKSLDKQDGLSIISLLIVCALIGFSALIILKLFPLYNEAFKVYSSMKAVAGMSEVGNKNSADIRTVLLRNFEVQDVDQFSASNIKKHLTIKREKGTQNRRMTMTYESRSPLFGNLDVVLKFDRTVTIRAAGSES